MDGSLEYQIYEELKKKGLTITTAESCTGGLVAGTLINVGGISDYLKEATKKQQENGDGTGYGGSGYGYLFWRGEHNSARADGKYGQLSILLPEKDSVITLLAEKPGSPRPLHDMVWQCLYPQL